MSGSIAAYKAAALARLLVGGRAVVQAVMTRAAERFVGRATFAGLTGSPVLMDMFQGGGEPHVALAQSSDLIAIVPATADLLARLAAGRAEDLVTATALCARCPVLIAPAMHPNMWEHAMTRANVERLAAVPNYRFVGPGFGDVASGDRGWGRLAEPEQIVDAIAATLAGTAASAAASQRSAKLGGRHVVVTAGPTVEDLDPVRALTNRSSGKMGFALARSAAECGARVSLITGPVSLATPAGVQRIDVRSALEMGAALDTALGVGLSGADALIMCAAVSDYRPSIVSATKLKRTSSALMLELVPNPDLLAEVGRRRAGTAPVLIGFAVETASGAQLVAAARKKLEDKNVDAIVANAATDALGTDETRAVIVTAAGERALGPASKARVSDDIIDFLAERLDRAPA